MRFFLAFFVGLILPAIAHAHLVVIDPNGYQGKYKLLRYDSLVSQSLSNTHDLAAGEYALEIGQGNAFLFKVDGDGSVTSLNTYAATVEDGNVLKLNTRQIFLSAGDFEGKFRVLGVEGDAEGQYFSGSRPVTLVGGMGSYILEIAPGSSFRFGLNLSGRIVVQNAANASVNAGGDAMTLNTETIRIRNNGYAGTFRVRNVTPDKLPKLYETIKVVPGVSGYRFELSRAPGAHFGFDVTSSGEVLTDKALAAAKGGGRVIDLQTTTVQITPVTYAGPWYVVNNSKVLLKGSQQVVLLKGMQGYGVEIVPGSTGLFALDRDGNPTEKTVSILDRDNTFQEFSIGKKVSSEFDCSFNAQIITYERIGSLAPNSKLRLQAQLHIHSPTVFGPNQVHYVWDGEMSVEHEASGESFRSRNGMMTILNDTPVGGDSINFSMDEAGGSLGGEFLSNTHIPLSLYLNGDVLKSGEFQLAYETWNKLDTRRRIEMPFQNTGKTGRIDKIEPTKGACTVR